MRIDDQLFKLVDSHSRPQHIQISIQKVFSEFLLRVLCVSVVNLILLAAKRL